MWEVRRPKEQQVTDIELREVMIAIAEIYQIVAFPVPQDVFGLVIYMAQAFAIILGCQVKLSNALPQ